jgi:hypothetical protein
MTFKVAELFLFPIRRFNHFHGYTDEFKVTGYCTRPVGPTSSRHARLSNTCLVEATRANDLTNGSNRMSFDNCKL